jgi:hypothetical protein
MNRALYQIIVTAKNKTKLIEEVTMSTKRTEERKFTTRNKAERQADDATMARSDVETQEPIGDFDRGADNEVSEDMRRSRDDAKKFEQDDATGD